MKFLVIFLILFSFKLFAAESIATNDHVDLEKYSGRWYVITSLPKFFTRNCVAQSALYTIKNNTSLSIINTCIKNNGSTRTIEGEANVVNPTTNAELVVSFNNFWTKLFRVKGDYTIIKFEADYSVTLVGSKNRKGLWLLSRTRTITKEMKEKYISLAKVLGYKVSTLVDSKF